MRSPPPAGPDTPGELPIERAAARCLADDALWAAMRDQAEQVLRDDAAARSVRTGVPHAEWNAVLRGAVSEDVPGVDVAEAADALVHDLLGPFVRTATSMLWHTDAATGPGVEAALHRAGLALEEREPVMVALAGAVPAVPPTGGVQVRTVDDDAGLVAWVRVLLGLDPRPDAPVHPRAGTVLDALVAARARVALPGAAHHAPHLLAFDGGVPVGCAAAFVTGPAAVVDHVVTDSSARRRGIGTALTAAAVSVGRDAGHDFAVLTASPDGYSLYRRLGFVEVGEVRRYLWEAPVSPTA